MSMNLDRLIYVSDNLGRIARHINNVAILTLRNPSTYRPEAIEYTIQKLYNCLRVLCKVYDIKMENLEVNFIAELGVLNDTNRD